MKVYFTTEYLYRTLRETLFNIKKLLNRILKKFLVICIKVIKLFILLFELKKKTILFKYKKFKAQLKIKENNT